MKNKLEEIRKQKGIKQEELAEQGIRMTFSTNWGCRRVVPGWKRTLQCMERMWISDGLTGEELLSKVQDRVARARVDLF